MLSINQEYTFHTFGKKIPCQIFRAHIVAAAKIAESADDMTAAETAPRPIKDTHCINNNFYLRNSILYECTQHC